LTRRFHTNRKYVVKGFFSDAFAAVEKEYKDIRTLISYLLDG